MEQRSPDQLVEWAYDQFLEQAADMLAPALDDAFQKLLGWADAVRDIGIRANADTPADAATAREFMAQGIGLCRTEHMFFEGERIHVMREMILAEDEAGRRAALDKLLPMQRSDFTELFTIMHGLPVTIRMLDPPLHEFLPKSDEEIEEVANAMGLEPGFMRRRIDAAVAQAIAK